MTRETGPRRLDSFAIQGLLVFGAQMAVNLSNFLFHAFVSRRIGVEEYGALNALVSAFNIFAVVAVVVTTVVAKTVAELRSAGAEGRIRDFSIRALGILGCVVVAISVVGWLGAPFFASYLQISSPTAIVLTAAILAVNFLLPLRGILQGAELFVPYAISLVLEAVLKVVLAVAIVALGFGLNGALSGWLIGAGIALAYTLFAGVVRFARASSGCYRIDYRRIGIATFGTVVAGLLLALMQFSDVVIVKHFLDPVQAGLYAAAALAGRMLFLLVNFVPIVLLPHAVRAAQTQGSPQKILAKALAVIVVLSGIGLVCYAVAPGLIVGTLAGSAFRPAAPLLFPYAIAAAIFAVLNTMVTYRIGVHRLGFIVPLAVVVAVEIGVMWRLHSSPLQIIEIMMIGNVVGIAVCCAGLIGTSGTTKAVVAGV